MKTRSFEIGRILCSKSHFFTRQYWLIRFLHLRKIRLRAVAKLSAKIEKCLENAWYPLNHFFKEPRRPIEISLTLNLWCALKWAERNVRVKMKPEYWLSSQQVNFIFTQINFWGFSLQPWEFYKTTFFFHFWYIAHAWARE